MAAVVDIGMMITQIPEIHGGRPLITGTGVTVQRIAIWHNMGFIPEEIADRVGHLSLTQIHAALAYYYANRETIDGAIAEEQAAYKRLAKEHYGNRNSTP